MSRQRLLSVIALHLVFLVAGCGKNESKQAPTSPDLSRKEDEARALTHKFDAGVDANQLQIVSLNEQAIALLREVFSESKDPDLRLAIMQSLGKCPDPDVLPVLVNGLKDADPNVRTAAAAFIGYGNEQTTPALREALRDEVWNVRFYAAETLGRLRAEEAVPDLIQTLKDKESSVRANTAKALGLIRDGRATSALCKVLEDDDWDVRACSARALGMLAAKEALPSLAKLLADPNDSVRTSAQRAIDVINGHNSSTEALNILGGRGVPTEAEADRKEDAKVVEVTGISLEAALRTAKAKAMLWNREATLRMVSVDRTSTYGRPDTAEASEFRVERWSFTFVSPEQEIRVYLVDPQEVKEGDKGESTFAARFPLIPEWKIGLNEAVAIALRASGHRLTGVSGLHVFAVNNEHVPVWIVTCGSEGVLVDARNGAVIPHKDAVFPLDDTFPQAVPAASSPKEKESSRGTVRAPVSTIEVPRLKFSEPDSPPGIQR